MWHMINANGRTDPESGTMTIQATPTKKACIKCKKAELHLCQPSILDRLTSFYPYSCEHCGHFQKRFHITAVGIIFPVCLGLLLSGGAWLYLNRAAFLPSGAAGNAAAAQREQLEALARARSATGGDLSTFEQMMLRKSKPAMDNATILRLVKANVGESVVIQLIRTSNADYDLSANAIIELKTAGVNETILRAMIDATYATH